MGKTEEIYKEINEEIYEELDKPVDFSDLIASKKAFFEALGIDEQTCRVQRWLERKGKVKLIDLTFPEYQQFCAVLARLWEKEGVDICKLKKEIEGLFAALGIDWNHQIIRSYLNSEAVRDEGLTSKNLQVLQDALKAQQ